VIGASASAAVGDTEGEEDEPSMNVKGEKRGESTGDVGKGEESPLAGIWEL